MFNSTSSVIYNNASVCWTIWAVPIACNNCRYFCDRRSVVSSSCSIRRGGIADNQLKNRHMRLLLYSLSDAPQKWVVVSYVFHNTCLNCNFSFSKLKICIFVHASVMKETLHKFGLCVGVWVYSSYVVIYRPTYS